MEGLPPRYTESKERSAELLRMALAQMARHPAAFNPVTFTLWYEHVAACNAPLSASLDHLKVQGRPVDDEAVLQLYRRHIAPADADAVERIGNQLQQLMNGMSRTASATGDHAGVFGAQLKDLAAALASQDMAQLTPQLSATIAQTGDMKLAVDTLRDKVAQSQGEIERLRGDLQRARDDALLDPLTGILNRKGFDRRLQALLETPDTGAGHGLVLLDIDHFKRVNDTHGHLTGDRVIQAVGEILRTSLAEPRHSAARYGGEEFAILLPNTPLDACVRVAEQVCKRTREMKLRRRGTQEVVLTVSLSAGVSALRPDDDGPSFVARVDAALYASKHAGRDRITCG